MVRLRAHPLRSAARGRSLERPAGLGAMLACGITLLLAVPLLPGGWVPANPAPSCMVFTHVHDAGAELCAGLPVATCEEITPITSRTGTLAFDFILDWRYGSGELLERNANLVFRIGWSSAWQFDSAQVCGSGVKGFEHDGDTAIFWIESLEGAPIVGDLAGLARLVLTVPCQGSLRCISYDGFEEYPEWPGARAGVACGSCPYPDCSYRFPMVPAPDPLQLELTANENGYAFGQFHVYAWGWDLEPPVGGFAFSETVAWLRAETTSLGDPFRPEYDVIVTAEAGGLEPGVHEGWIEVQAPWCSECEKIVFTVPAAPPAAQGESWGRLKARFR
jgi:hypothetical protein